jgi:hypothetical protein
LHLILTVVGAQSWTNIWLWNTEIAETTSLRSFGSLGLHAAAQPISRKWEQICSRSVTTCCQQGAYLDAFARLVPVCSDRSATACRQVCYKLLWQSCSNTVFIRPVASCWHRAAAMLFSTTCDRPVVNRGKCLKKLRVSTIFRNKKRPNKLPYLICRLLVVFHKIIRLLYTNLRDNFWAKRPKKYDEERFFIVHNFQN